MLSLLDDPRCLIPIPDRPEPPNWARLPIAENRELLADVRNTERLRVRAVYAEMRIPGAHATLQLREGAHTRLCRAADSLPDYVALCLFDGFRPLSVQTYLYEGYWEEVARDHPGWNETAIASQVQQFVARPNPSLDAPPPHRTGGAADVYLMDAATGEPLPMGTDADEISPRSVTGWYETFPEPPFTRNRRLLFHALTEQGFTNYRGEWWHFDFGNQRWANIAGKDAAIYGVPLQERHPELWQLIPRDKFDITRLEQVVRAGYPVVKPILPELLRWLQDANWPVATPLGDFLCRIGEPLAPYVRQILNGDDAMWKYWIIKRIIAPSPDLMRVMYSDLEVIASGQPADEDDAEVVEAARETLSERHYARPERS